MSLFICVMESVFDIQERKNYFSIYENSDIARVYTEQNGNKLKQVKNTIMVGEEIGKRSANIVYDGSASYDFTDFKQNESIVNIDNITKALSSIESYRNLLVKKESKNGD